MSLTADRASLELQLERAKEALNAWKTTLDEKGVAEDNRRRDPKWRSLSAECGQIMARLRQIQAIEQRDAEVERRKSAESAEEGE